MPVLLAWLREPSRRPLVLRGARQVGKTWLVRNLALAAGRDLVEVNFERDPGFKRAFVSNDPGEILARLSLLTNRDVNPERSILFLDELQAAPEMLAKLRWFYEELPSLPVIAAGSLLDLTLGHHTFSMPVGRITFRHLEPMSFPEFLEAHGRGRLRVALASWRPGQILEPLIHEQAHTWFSRYAMVGGMPAVLAADVNGRSPKECRELQRDLVATYRADFTKYSGRMNQGILDTVLHAVAGSLGRKFVYARAGDGVNQHQAKRALELLAAARLCNLVRHSSANGLPLGGEVKDTFRKAVLLDVGLVHALLGTPAAQAFPEAGELSPALRGQLADQLVGQQLRQVMDASGDGPELFYWQREGGRPGEIDYLVQLKGRIVPVEVKAGAAGTMKSLHQFMAEKRLEFAVRCDVNPPTLSALRVKTTTGKPVAYRLLNVPLYLIWNLGELAQAT